MRPFSVSLDSGWLSLLGTPFIYCRVRERQGIRQLPTHSNKQGGEVRDWEGGRLAPV
ncbi:UNVERIFIED_CONTAM: hypothetical protein FKN15_039603 [Acipenser sinensis]